ncbi:uncharacterized protein LOC113204734 [Frankliniella occidentalis]|uniref:Uncharacterized protein LOC113204734 n=1 Tax=Frankliniella occidentalis TaxID=133901 RepID=A0A6J1S556_FRAOC|nr:uncharacterized protein LOC113204734 [Frankliniella occidentalis]
MARNNVIMVSTALLAALLLGTLPLGRAQPTSQDDADAAAVATEPRTPTDVMLGDEAVADDEDMRGRMAFLILSLWDRELQGLDGVDTLAEGHARKRRETVFRPLWVSKDRHAHRQRLRQRYWAELRRAQRFGRDAEAAEARRHHHQDAAGRPLFHLRAAQAERALSRARRAAAPLSEAELMDAAVDGELQRLSRVRRQWAFRPLFVGKESQARYRRPRRDVDDDDVEEVVTAADTMEAAPSRRRREFVDVPLFAVKQIEAERHREEEEITHPHYRAEQRQRLDQAEEAAREYRNYYRGNYRDYYRYYG